MTAIPNDIVQFGFWRGCFSILLYQTLMIYFYPGLIYMFFLQGELNTGQINADEAGGHPQVYLLLQLTLNVLCH